MMQCEARRIDGSHASAVIDLTDLANPDIENCDGILIDDAVLDRALDRVQAFLPAQAVRIEQREDEIKAYMAGTYTPGPAEIAAVDALARRDRSEDDGLFSVSPCVTSCTILAVDVVITLFAYRGLGRARLEAIAMNPGVRQHLMGRAQQIAVQRLVAVIRNPQNAMEFADALLGLVSAIVTMSFVKAIVQAADDELSWWDRVKFSTAFTAQAVALFTPAGPAVVYAKGVLLFLSLEGLVEDAAHVVSDCS